MTNRSNNGRALARRSAAATRQPRSLGDIAAALGLTLDDLYPMWLLRFADGTLVHQRGINAADGQLTFLDDQT